MAVQRVGMTHGGMFVCLFAYSHCPMPVTGSYKGSAADQLAPSSLLYARQYGAVASARKTHMIRPSGRRVVEGSPGPSEAAPIPIDHGIVLTTSHFRAVLFVDRTKKMAGLRLQCL